MSFLAKMQGMKHGNRWLLLGLALLIVAALALWSGELAGAQDGQTVRIIAKLHADDRIEFGLRTADGDVFPKGSLLPVEHYP